MSVQFGRWNFDERPPAAEYIEKVTATLATYGPDSNESYSHNGVTILYHSFCTTKESLRETQPHRLTSGSVLTWDGRLDNRAELIGELQDKALSPNSTDLQIVTASLERWGDRCLEKLVGSWALALWNPRDQVLLLAKDPIGTKHLYYSFNDKRVTWSTILDPLVLFADRTFDICEEYVAGWLSNQFPDPQITPYVGIQAVPPSCCVLLRSAKHKIRHTITKYWEFEPHHEVRYSNDDDYKEHFRAVFATAVQRCLRSDRPVLAELSGGMDSSSIVCMADLIMESRTRGDTRCLALAARHVDCPRLDTISWFTDLYEEFEPDTNAFGWISEVENKRGRTGFHINLSEFRSQQDRPQTGIMAAFDNGGFASTLAPRTLSRFFSVYAAHIASQGYRVTLSGIGGDHVTGREPDPRPELQNLIARGHFLELAGQLNAWAIALGRARTPLLWESVRDFFPRRNMSKDILAARWIRSQFIRRNYATLCNRSIGVNILGHLPSCQHSLRGLDQERRIAARWDLNPYLLREVRYPYLDRDFLRFMYAIPREQVVNGSQHRFLMRRALVGIVPDEVLKRVQKTFRRPESERKQETNRLADKFGAMELDSNMLSGAIGIIECCRFSETLTNIKAEEETVVEMVSRTLKLESWLRHLASRKILQVSQRTESPISSSDREVPTRPYHEFS